MLNSAVTIWSMKNRCSGAWSEEPGNKDDARAKKNDSHLCRDTKIQ